ncbi:hypothetical protein B4Q13_24315 [Lacticaseibacillus rhamnosus]
MAIPSSKMAGLNVPNAALTQLNKLLDARADDKDPAAAALAAYLLCRQYMGWGPRNPAIVKGVEQLSKRLPDGKGEVSFDLSDSVTTFQVTAFAHTLDGRLGFGHRQRDRDREGRPLAFDTCAGNLAAHGPGEALADGEAKPAAAAFASRFLPAATNPPR